MRSSPIEPARGCRYVNATSIEKLGVVRRKTEDTTYLEFNRLQNIAFG